METRTISNRQSNRDRLLSGKGKTRKLYSKCCCARTPASRARISKQTDNPPPLSCFPFFSVVAVVSYFQIIQQNGNRNNAT